jgi:hypothetical protein
MASHLLCHLFRSRSEPWLTQSPLQWQEWVESGHSFLALSFP